MRMSLATLTLAAALFLPASLAEAAPVRNPEVRQTATLKAPAAPTPPQEARAVSYAERERQARDLESFAGGKDDVVYISVGAVLLIILILILI